MRWCIIAGCLGLALAGLAGCGTSRPYPEKQLFALNLGQPPAATPTPRFGVVRVSPAWVASPYDGQSFVYRTTTEKMAADYYNGFVDSPAKLLTADVVHWLDGTGLFAAVIRDDSHAHSDYRLEFNVTDLSGDYRNKQSPAAVMAIRFFVLQDADMETRILFDKNYTARVPLKGSTPDALAAAFGQALQENLAAFCRDIADLQPKKD